jgi:hypothetical protein
MAAAFGVAALLLSGAAQAQAQVGYTFDVTTGYGFGNPLGGSTYYFNDAGDASPDTGYWMVRNSGTTTFTGSVGQVTDVGGGGNYNYSHVITLNPGDSAIFAVNSESSNVGGFNGVTGTTENGLQINMVGTVNGEGVALSVYDKDIHSGVFRSANGTPSDSYVLQGGDPLGGDTGDDFEVTQAFGHFQFFEAGGATTPEPGSLALLGFGALSLGGYAWRRMKRQSA